MSAATEQQVLELLASKAGRALDFLNPDKVKELVHFWMSEIGLPARYFEIVSAEDILKHVESLAAELAGQAASGSTFDMEIRHETETSALYVVPSSVSGKDSGMMRYSLGPAQSTPVHRVENYIEQTFFSRFHNDEDEHADVQTQARRTLVRSLSTAQPHSPGSPTPGSTILANRPFRLQAFRSKAAVEEAGGAHLRLYLLQACEFVNPKPADDETRIEELADKGFLSDVDAKTKAAYQEVVRKTVETGEPVFQFFQDFEDEGHKATLLLVSHFIGDTHSFFVGMPAVYRHYYMFAHTKYVEMFSNGIIVFAFYLNPLSVIRQPDGSTVEPSSKLVSRMAHMEQDASLHFVLPKHSFTPLLTSGKLSVQETTYAYCAAKFAFHFLNRGERDHREVALALQSSEALAALSRLRAAFRMHAFNEGFIVDAVITNKQLISVLYDDFAARHMPSFMHRRSRVISSSNPETGGTMERESGKERLLQLVRESCKTEGERTVFEAFVTFNTSILKTNYYKPSKRAISFRLEPSILSSNAFTERPFGVFMIVGAEFRGFHVRFRDVARGGIRLVRSRYPQAYNNNVSALFDECFNLASTQQRKNKDIPEGGSKGVILLGWKYQDKGQVAFRKFVDAVLDCMIPDEQYMIDHYGKEELLFLGPDEGTADFMDWASLHARKRGYKYWKAFTTGKGTSLGGIPHDTYGMTTNSVRAYVEGIQEQLGLDPKKCTKMQTGGPDGDLGSNEIKMGLEKTVAIVDGSGVAYDPEGLDKEELTSLATRRIMVSNFNKDKFSPQGFFVNVEESDCPLPDGSTVPSGLDFRNVFHLNPMVHVDFFVPCGGRPAAVSTENYKAFLYDNDGRLRVKYIVEGANLFFTQEARLKIEEAGVILIKDASANKGGVTSSSLEVLAALCLTDEEFVEHMAIAGDVVPELYQTYVKEVQGIINNNAKLEFKCMWEHHKATNEPMSIISDLLSNKIVHLRDAILASERIWTNQTLKTNILKRAIPKTLQEFRPLDVLTSRLPAVYLKTLFASYLSSRFVYSQGLLASDLAFFEYVQELSA
ncbi:NAD+ dependent glutamate dehydrogenase [Salpingoeca rosetta]|uniref:NAD+ dependent glutamate dehydrogenase n=1 Tax=Salpingoeca rosetta (strain ATCC 50818 / BSB-021) TaxID=946362 RepID=F2U5T7_SALR5|nr:NAD+ dependent glutamate dehydrogenase [Salpingoeca rosetta]EGD82878.1 NAD+ dependent glutamate dehydrogenase [Salpingoeca rosetta]|eukprot:XP_004995242.1 NAD+ dependent glutamate dehydrogenase [Salpingoeca rosetta]